MTNTVAPEIHEIEQLATEIAGRAGDMLRDRFRSAIEVRFKDRRGLDPVTDVDHAVEAMVRAAVHARFPTHALLGEEGDDSGPPDADYVWVVDPLDGTANFVNGLPLFSCSIGVVHHGEPVVGAIWASTGRRLQPGVYHAARCGGGLRFDGMPVPYAPLEVDQPNRLSALPGGVIGVTGPRGRRFGVARTLGSIALELALTADGSFRYCVIGDGKIWDVAAGVALCLAAGAQVSAKPVGGEWRSLERFIPGETAPSVATLRDWREKIVVGDPAVVPELARDLAREQGRLGSLRRLFFGSES